MELALTVRARADLASPGEWCDACLLPSAWSVPVEMLDGADRVVATGEGRYCEDCKCTWIATKEITDV